MKSPSEHLSLEVAASTEARRAAPAERTVLVIIGEADVRAYVGDCLRRRADLQVLEVASVAAALEAAERGRAELLVAGRAEAAAVRHLPAVPAVLLADDMPEVGREQRPAPLVLLRGAFGPQLLLKVVATLLEGNHMAGAAG